MRRREKSGGTDPLANLAQKIEILERELALQRQAMDRLKQIAVDHRARRMTRAIATGRKTA